MSPNQFRALNGEQKVLEMRVSAVTTYTIIRN